MDMDGFDDVYFSEKSWVERLDDLIEDNEQIPGNRFFEENVSFIKRILGNEKIGLRVVINITSDALLSFLDSNHYQNIYENPVIGGEARTASPHRKMVDNWLNFKDDPGKYYFGAASMADAGVRYYGDYCMVLKTDAFDPDTRIFDRDSYDLLNPPLREYADQDHAAIVNMLSGEWNRDAVSMLALQIANVIRHNCRLVTTGTVAELVIRDQEFVEIHKYKSFGRDAIEEIRISPDDVTLEMELRNRKDKGQQLRVEEDTWLNFRSVVRKKLEAYDIPLRVMNLYG